MEITHQSPFHRNVRTPDFGIHYAQSDIDTIREQIEQTEAMKRRWLFLIMMISVAALAGSIVLLSTNYALYSSSESENKKLATENTALKSRAEQTQQQLDLKTAEEQKQASARADAQKKLRTTLPSVLRGNSGSAEVARFAKMVYDLPDHQVDLDSKPPNKLFRNWKVGAGETAETYSLVGGFVDGKWVISSSLVARK